MDSEVTCGCGRIFPTIEAMFDHRVECEDAAEAWASAGGTQFYYGFEE